MPIGLGMNHLEQEIAACQLWNRNIEDGKPAETWIELADYPDSELFAKNLQTGYSLENSGFLEIDKQSEKFRLTAKAVALLEKFTENQ